MAETARQPRPKKPRVCPFEIVVDTREQAPLTFSNIGGYDVINKRFYALPTGDYSIVGMESRIAIERKSVADFYHSIGSDRERFEREMVRLSRMEFAAVVIEGMVTDRPSIVRMGVKSATHTIMSWEVRYGVIFRECPHGRREAELRTFHYLRHFHKQDQERAKELVKKRLAVVDEAVCGVV